MWNHLIIVLAFTLAILSEAGSAASAPHTQHIRTSTPKRIKGKTWSQFRPRPIPGHLATRSGQSTPQSPSSNQLSSFAPQSQSDSGGTSSGSDQAPVIIQQPVTSCRKPGIRRDWKTMTSRDKASYIQATKCLRSKPSRMNHYKNTSLFDDYSVAHIKGAYSSTPIHYTAQFLPWHRLMLNQRTIDLRNCGYSGPTPYWDWATDADARRVPQAAVFAADALSGSCVCTGAMKGFKANIVDNGDGVEVLSHKITRQFNNGSDSVGDMSASSYDSSSMATAMSITDYFNFLLGLEEVPHDTVHSVLGGDDGDVATMAAPNDALFFLIHANVDRYFTNWQIQNPSAGYMGPRSDADNAPWTANLTDSLNMYKLVPGKVTVADVWNTKGNYLCYTYDK